MDVIRVKYEEQARDGVFVKGERGGGGGGGWFMAWGCGRLSCGGSIFLLISKKAYINSYQC